MILIRLFQTRDLAMAYYDTFKNNKGDLKGLNDQGFPLFAISSGNYQLFYVARTLTDTRISSTGRTSTGSRWIQRGY
ncbi:MAG: hypothetical protein IPI95_10620 [Flavobacteriales bacterium]|nr:hypothetical protein [Flavobacteriales bacterium]